MQLRLEGAERGEVDDDVDGADVVDNGCWAVSGCSGRSGWSNGRERGRVVRKVGWLDQHNKLAHASIN